MCSPASLPAENNISRKASSRPGSGELRVERDEDDVHVGDVVARRHNERSLESELGEETNPEVPLAPEPMPDDAAVMNESAALVREALLTLGESYRSVVVLRHYQDLKFREIADALGIPEGTAKSRMAEAMSQLARLLQPVFEEESKRIPPPLARPRHKESFIL